MILVYMSAEAEASNFDISLNKTKCTQKSSILVNYTLSILSIVPSSTQIFVHIFYSALILASSICHFFPVIIYIMGIPILLPTKYRVFSGAAQLRA